jgi:hypothetical protein
LADDIQSCLTTPSQCEDHFVIVEQCTDLNQPLAGAGSYGLTDGTPRHSSSNNVKGFGVAIFVVFSGQMTACRDLFHYGVSMLGPSLL